MSTFALCSTVTGQVYTHRGRLLVHDSREELEFLFPASTTVDVSGQNIMPELRIKDHPDMAGISWPIQRQDFR